MQSAPLLLRDCDPTPAPHRAQPPQPDSEPIPVQQRAQPPKRGMRYKTAGEPPPFRTKIRAGFRKFSFRRPCPEVRGPISGQISPPKEIFDRSKGAPSSEFRNSSRNCVFFLPPSECTLRPILKKYEFFSQKNLHAPNFRHIFALAISKAP